MTCYLTSRLSLKNGGRRENAAGGDVDVHGVPGHLQGSSAAAVWPQHVHAVSGEHEGALLRAALPLPGLQVFLWAGHQGAEELQPG